MLLETLPVLAGQNRGAKKRTKNINRREKEDMGEGPT
jgi:hypothetical protein